MLKLTKAQRNWLISMNRHRQWIIGPGRKMRYFLTSNGLIEQNKEGAWRITQKGINLITPSS